MPFLEANDVPEAMISCGRREQTTVAPQALFVLNDPFVRQQAKHFARLLESRPGDDPHAAVERAYWLSLSRPPTQEELRLAVEFLKKEGQDLLNFCHTLFTLNEFIYVD